MMRPDLAAVLGVCLLAGACTTTDVLDVSGGGPPPPAPVGETSATAFATEQPSPVPPMAPSQPDGAQPLAPAEQTPEPAAEWNIPQPEALPPPAMPEPPRVAAVAPATTALVQVAPIVGATPGSVAPLSQRLALRAAERGISLTNNEGGTHVLRGYFSAMQQGGNAVVIYVWDVIDRAGSRVHRIQGQEMARMAGGDVWNSIGDRTMEMIADKTIDDLSAWLGSHPG